MKGTEEATHHRAEANALTGTWPRARLWAYVIALGGLFGVVDSSQSYFLGKIIGIDLPLRMILSSNVIYWVAFGILVPPVVLVAERIRLDGPARWSRIAAHCVGGVLFSIAHATLYVTLMSFVPGISRMPAFSGTFSATLFRIIREYSASEFLVYWAIVGALYALHYYRESQRRQIAAARLQTTLTETRLEALRSQINPHFLFNTLNSISTLALRGEHTATVEMLERLSDLLRVSLDDRCPQEVSLSRELEFLDRYLAIQRVRFADRLTICQKIAPETHDALVPSMILQPLAENALRHGIDVHCGAGTITIEAERQNGALQLRVSDSGPGFPSESRTAARLGIGLSNTHARLEQLYGTRQQIVFGRSEGGGGTVTITIPFRTDTSAEDSVQEERTAS
jgi:signal transduction histidine kinase